MSWLLIRAALPAGPTTKILHTRIVPPQSPAQAKPGGAPFLACLFYKTPSTLLLESELESSAYTGLLVFALAQNPNYVFVEKLECVLMNKITVISSTNWTVSF